MAIKVKEICIINVHRAIFTEYTVQSIVSINGLHHSLAMENKQFLIPCGTYRVIEDKVGKNGISLSVLNVPNRSAIEIHCANYYNQLRGCIALGGYFNGEILNQSHPYVKSAIDIVNQSKLAYLVVSDVSQKILNKG